MICAGGQSWLGFSAGGQAGLEFSAGGQSGLGFSTGGQSRLGFFAGGQPGFCWLLEVAHWSYNQVSVALLSPCDTKKQTPLFPAQLKNQQLQKQTSSTLVHEKVNHRTGRTCWTRKKTPTTNRDCDSARRERKPRKSHKTRISAKSNMRTGHLHLVALKRQTSLVLLPLKKVERKEADL